jgi:Resolvase, N terminal domain
VVNDLAARGVGLNVLAGHGAIVDSTVPSGKLAFDIFAALASSRHELRVERRKAGMADARARGGKVAVSTRWPWLSCGWQWRDGQRETNVKELCPGNWVSPGEPFTGTWRLMDHYGRTGRTRRNDQF